MSKLNVMEVELKMREYHGNIAAAARELGVTRQTVYNLLSQTPYLQDVLKDCRETVKDHAESALHKAIFEGESWAIRYYLSTQAKERGYVQRQELAGPDGSDIPLKIEYVQSPPRTNG